VRIREFFQVYTNKPDSRLFFPKTVIIRTKLDMNSCISGSCDFEFLKFVSSFILMITVFGKTIANRGYSCIPKKTPEFLSILLNLHYEFVRNRAISGEFT
jgi:hypothetical protein